MEIDYDLYDFQEMHFYSITVNEQHFSSINLLKIHVRVDVCNSS